MKVTSKPMFFEYAKMILNKAYETDRSSSFTEDGKCVHGSTITAIARLAENQEGFRKPRWEVEVGSNYHPMETIKEIATLN